MRNIMILDEKETNIIGLSKGSRVLLSFVDLDPASAEVLIKKFPIAKEAIAKVNKISIQIQAFEDDQDCQQDVYSISITVYKKEGQRPGEIDSGLFYDAYCDNSLEYIDDVIYAIEKEGLVKFIEKRPYFTELFI